MRTLSSNSATAIAAGAEALAAIIASVTGCVLVRERIKYTVLPTPPGAAAIGSSIRRAGAFFLGTGGTTPEAVVVIPGIVDSVLETTGPRAGYGIDATNSDIIAFVSELIAIGATNPFADAIVVLDDAYVQSRV